MSNNNALCWLNGQLLPAQEASVSVYDHGLLYGDGVFEGIRFYKNKAFQPVEHIKRLFDSAQALLLKIPYSIEELTNATIDSINASPLDNGYIRLIVTRGEGSLGMDPSSCKHPNVIMITDRISLISEAVRTQGAKLIIASTRRLPVDGLDPRIKSLNYLNPILAKMEAQQANADEAVLLNQQGFVAEGSADNIFIVREGQLRTPGLHDGALAGITRATILKLAETLDISVTETSLAPYDLYTADECFLSGTAAELIPVREIGGREIKHCPGPIFTQIQGAFQNLIL